MFRINFLFNSTAISESKKALNIIKLKHYWFIFKPNTYIIRISSLSNKDSDKSFCEGFRISLVTLI